LELANKIEVAWSRVQKDRRTDFIIGDFEYLVYGAYATELLARLEERIDNGDEYTPSPLRTIRVPKEAHTTRPGAVPEIDDRIVYQYLVDDIAETVEPGLVPLEAQVVHSYRYAGDRSSADMFVLRETRCHLLPGAGHHGSGLPGAGGCPPFAAFSGLLPPNPIARGAISKTEQ
jgi:hypothetical protein